MYQYNIGGDRITSHIKQGKYKISRTILKGEVNVSHGCDQSKVEIPSENKIG